MTQNTARGVTFDDLRAVLTAGFQSKETGSHYKFLAALRQLDRLSEAAREQSDSGQGGGSLTPSQEDAVHASEPSPRPSAQPGASEFDKARQNWIDAYDTWLHLVPDHGDDMAKMGNRLAAAAVAERDRLVKEVGVWQGGFSEQASRADRERDRADRLQRERDEAVALLRNLDSEFAWDSEPWRRVTKYLAALAESGEKQP